MFHSGYNSTEAFNDSRLVDIARLVPFGPDSGHDISQDDSSLPLNTAVCHTLTPTTTSDNTSVDDEVPADSQSMLTDLKLGVSLPVSLATGLPQTKTVTEAEPVEPKLETAADLMQHNPPRVTPEALNALETLLGMWDLKVHFGILACQLLNWFLGRCAIFCKLCLA